NSSNQNQTKTASDGMAIGGCRSDSPEPAKERQPVRKANCKEELRHDRIGVAAIGIVVLENIRDRVELANEVDEKHAEDCVAPELIERNDACRRLLRRTHYFLATGDERNVASHDRNRTVIASRQYSSR